MLARSAGRRQRRHTSRLLATSFAPLNLPWLAPAQLRWSASRASTTPSARSGAQGRATTRTPPPTHSRSLATATDHYEPRESPSLPPSAYKTIPDSDPSKGDPRFTSVRPYYDPVVLNMSARTPQATIRVMHGVQGTEAELLQYLRTSLQVGRTSRAEAILNRLNQQCASDSPEIMYAHSLYLEQLLSVVALHGRGEEAQKTLRAMQNWLDEKVVQNGISVDAKMLVIMIRATIRALDGPSRDMKIREYADMGRSLDGEGFEEVLESEEYDDNEFTILGRVTSDFYEVLDEAIPAEQQLDQSASASIDTSALPQSGGTPADAETVPEVRSTSQKGTGLRAIKRSLEGLENAEASAGEFMDEHQLALHKQEGLERASVEVAVERWKEADAELKKLGVRSPLQTKPMGALMWQWQQDLVAALERELADCKSAYNKEEARMDHRHFYGCYLETVSLKSLAANTILHAMSMAASKRMDKLEKVVDLKFGTAAMSLANLVQEECEAEVSRAKGELTGRKKRGRPDRRIRQNMSRPGSPKKLSKARQARVEELEALPWPVEARAKFGGMLIAKLVEVAQLPVTRQHPRTREKITQMQPALLHSWKYEKGKKIGIIKPNEVLVQKMSAEPAWSLLAKRMPMVVRPKPWTSWSSGGFLHYTTNILRIGASDSGARDYFMAAHEKDDLGQIYSALNVLGEVPWRVHPGVFRTQLEAWNSGEPLGGFAPLEPKYDLPRDPGPSAQPLEKRKWLMDMKSIENHRTGLHSKRCFQNFQLETARSLRNETIYFPHNIDFRGRCYPIPPYLNHMGADNVRGLLVFAKGRKLGVEGLRWLKIHLATVAGHDKASMSERIQFTEDHLEEIYDSANNPLGGRRWWLQADDSWQLLAACFEMTEAMKMPDPTEFESHIPIQQDGTCNGLQHYAALGGDMAGATQVNLEPGDRPADVYTAVAEAVKSEVARDAKLGDPVAMKLDGHVTRKMVKQPVMTNVYGVTFFGAKEQVRKQLEAVFTTSRADEAANFKTMSSYVATKIFKSLGTMFKGAQSIQTWLGQCADRVSTSISPEQIEAIVAAQQPGASKAASTPAIYRAAQSLMDPNEPEAKMLRGVRALFKTGVIWTSPLRLPVVQPYRNPAMRRVETTLQKIDLKDPQVWDPVNKRKQLQAFPPNFIHSLDATHMMLSALKCKQQGLTFASIHDSFWTHAADVHTLNTQLRDAFVEMHSEDITGRLHEELKTRYKDHFYLASVLFHSPVGQAIKDFRMEQKKLTKGEHSLSEFNLELRRQKLLRSEDPTEQAQGREMVTPASIMESFSDPSAFVKPSEVLNQTLGRIPGRKAQDKTTRAAAGDGKDDDTAEPNDAVDSAAADESIDAGTNTDADAHFDPDTDAHSDLDAEPVDVEAGAKFQQNKKSVQEFKKLQVWMPLTFPDVPEKGEFDVRKISKSDYFFH